MSELIMHIRIECRFPHSIDNYRHGNFRSKYMNSITNTHTLIKITLIFPLSINTIVCTEARHYTAEVNINMTKHLVSIKKITTHHYDPVIKGNSNKVKGNHDVHVDQQSITFKNSPKSTVHACSGGSESEQ